MGEGAAEVLAQSAAHVVGEGRGRLQPGLEVLGGVGQPEGLQLGGPALRVLSEQHEVAGVGDEHEAVRAPVAAHLIAVRGQPCVVAGGLDLDHAALGKLALSRSALLRLAGGVESEVGVARAVVGELGDAGHLGLEGGADGVEQVAEGRVVGALAGGAAGRADGAEVGEVGLDGGCEPGCGRRHCDNVAEGGGKCKVWGRPRRRCVGGSIRGAGREPPQPSLLPRGEKGQEPSPRRPASGFRPRIGVRLRMTYRQAVERGCEGGGRSVA